jgi:hypothetical protein
MKMKRRIFKGISLMLTFILILGIFPISAFAADNEDVLTSVSHTSAVSAAVNAENDTVTLTVPYAYTGDVDLSSGLDISFDASVYASASAGFPDGATAVVGGDAVKMLITYQRTGETALYTTEYAVSVVRAAQTAPAFSGTITKSVSLPNIITFTAADFSEKYVKNEGGELASIVITGSDPSFGSLKLGNTSALGKTVTVADLQSGNLTFVPNNAGTVSYTVGAYASGTEASVGSALLTITVNEPSNAGSVAYTTGENTPAELKSIDFSSSFYAATGKTLSYVKFVLPSSDKGTLYYNYSSGTVYESAVSADTKYYSATYPNISYITFVPRAGFSGTVSIPYTGYVSGGDGYSGTLTITVNGTGIDNIIYTTDEDTPVSFKASDFNAVCTEVTGETLQYVKFTLPAAGSGKLYYNYTSSTDYDFLVAADTKYYYDAEPYLSNVDFVPAAGFNGTVKISYTGCSTGNVSFGGEITVIIGEKEEDSDHFGDVGKNVSWAVEAIDYLYEQGILKGDGTGYYNPQASISKGDFMLMLCRAFDLEPDLGSNFSDVDEDDYFYDAVGTAKKLGIAKGSNGKFNPRSALSREDAMVFIVRALEVSGIELPDGSDSDLQPFTDKHKISGYAEDAFKALVKAGIIEGTGKALNPKSSVSRAEIAVILYRVLTM